MPVGSHAPSAPRPVENRARPRFRPRWGHRQGLAAIGADRRGIVDPGGEALERALVVVGEGAGARVPGQLVEPREVREQQPRVVATAGGDDLAVIPDLLLDPVDRAAGEHVLAERAGREQRRVPRAAKRRRGAPLAIGGAIADADGGGSIAHRPASGERVEELDLPLAGERAFPPISGSGNRFRARMGGQQGLWRGSGVGGQRLRERGERGGQGGHGRSVSREWGATNRVLYAQSGAVGKWGLIPFRQV